MSLRVHGMLTPEVQSALTQLRSKLTDPDHWSRWAPAQNDAGRMVSPSAETAVAWSLPGAVDCVPLNIKMGVWQALENGFKQYTRSKPLQFNWAQWNAMAQHKDVLAVIDAALEGIRE